MSADSALERVLRYGSRAGKNLRDSRTGFITAKKPHHLLIMPAFKRKAFPQKHDLRQVRDGGREGTLWTHRRPQLLPLTDTRQGDPRSCRTTNGGRAEGGAREPPGAGAPPVSAAVHVPRVPWARLAGALQHVPARPSQSQRQQPEHVSEPARTGPLRLGTDLAGRLGGRASSSNQQQTRGSDRIKRPNCRDAKPCGKIG